MQVTADLRLMDGDKVIVEEEGDLRITWNDSTVTQFKDESEASFNLKKGKQIYLDNGKFQAQVTKQAPNNPMIIHTPNSKVTVLGTRFRLKVNDEQSLLEVDRGKVELQNNKGQTFDCEGSSICCGVKKY